MQGQSFFSSLSVCRELGTRASTCRRSHLPDNERVKFASAETAGAAEAGGSPRTGSRGRAAVSLASEWMGQDAEVVEVEEANAMSRMCRRRRPAAKAWSEQSCRDYTDEIEARAVSWCTSVRRTQKCFEVRQTWVQAAGVVEATSALMFVCVHCDSDPDCVARTGLVQTDIRYWHWCPSRLLLSVGAEATAGVGNGDHHRELASKHLQDNRAHACKSQHRRLPLSVVVPTSRSWSMTLFPSPCGVA